MKSTSFPCRVAIYVPREGKTAASYVAAAISRIAGGATIYPATGHWWIDEVPAILTEEIDVVVSFCSTERYAQLHQLVLQLADMMLRRDQQAVAVEIGRQLTLFKTGLQ